MYSLPISANILSGGTADVAKTDSTYLSHTFGLSVAAPIDHSVRRGRMWTYAGVPYDKDNTASGSSNYKFGFQFLYNPTDITINVHRNQDMVPSTSDFLQRLGGNFQGQESISFTIYLDRTNDFAAIKSGKQIDVDSYKTGYGGGDITSKIQDLLKRGTNHDVEYFFKTINGDGGTYKDYKNRTLTPKHWKNGLGKVTADTGYLAPTEVAILFGPSLQNSMSFIGYIESVNIHHMAFTEDMIPIRTQMDFNMVAFSQSATS